MQKVYCHNNDFQSKLKEVNGWNIKPNEKKKVKDFFRDYELGKITRKRSENPEGNLLRNLYALKVALENLKGSSSKEVEQFVEDLLKDNIKHKNKNYVLKSKKTIFKVLSAYLKWKLKDKSTKVCSVLDIDIKSKTNDIETLTEEEINKLFDEKIPIDKQFLLCVLNAGGMRAEEFHNIRFSDISVPEGKEPYVKINLRHQFSKSEGRHISLYDKRVSPIVKKYLSLRISEGVKPEEPIFPLSYGGTRQWLGRFGEKTIGKKINYHLFRHTTATRYASKMNRQQLCIYFGWKFSSPMPDIYIKRSGVDMHEVENKFQSSQMEELEKEINELKPLKKLYDELKELNKQREEEYNDMDEKLKSLNDFMKEILLKSSKKN